MIRNLTLIAILFASALIACTQQKKPSGQAVVTINTSVDVDTLWYHEDKGEYFIHAVRADQPGHFTVTFQKDLGSPLLIGPMQDPFKDVNLNLEDGDSVFITTNFSDSACFSGKGGIKQDILWQQKQRSKNLVEQLDWTKLTPDEAFSKYIQFRDESIAILNKHRHEVSPAFYNGQMISYKYETLNQLVAIPYTLKVYSDVKRDNYIPAGFWDIEKEIEMDDKLLSKKEYYEFIRYPYVRFLRYKQEAQSGQPDTSRNWEVKLKRDFDLIASHYTGKTRSMALKEVITGTFINMKDASLAKPYMDLYFSQYAEPEDKQATLDSYNGFTRTSVGKTPPPFTLKDQDGKPVTLKDFSGKVVYMDFWASWCSPCRFQMKNGSPNLHAKFKDNKDVVFLYVSVDQDTAAWKRAIQEDKIEGIHLLADKGQEGEVASAFNIQSTGLPVYILIGKDGKILDNDATRPSQPETVEKIREALKL